jgi:hypothetical protein
VSRTVHRILLSITDHTTVDYIVGFRRALYAAPVRPAIGDPDMQFELWYEIDDRLMEHQYPLRVHVEGTGHPIEHDGEYVSTLITAGGQLVWHVYVEYPAVGS